MAAAKKRTAKRVVTKTAAKKERKPIAPYLAVGLSTVVYGVAERKHIRRNLAAAYDRIAKGKRFTQAERQEFARMAEAWRKTLPKK